MKKPIVAIALTATLGSCASPLGNLSLKDGETGCINANSLTLGKASMIVTRADNVGKGQMNTGTQKITCGEATLEISTSTGPAIPQGATVTTTVVQPAKPAP